MYKYTYKQTTTSGARQLRKNTSFTQENEICAQV